MFARKMQSAAISGWRAIERGADAGQASRITVYVPAPDRLKAFPDARLAKPKTKTESGLRKRWRDNDSIYEWDRRHGTVEIYDRRGRHLGEFDAETGRRLKPANPDRRVEP